MTLTALLRGRIGLRQWAKYRVYGPRGWFPYYGYRVYFPKGCGAFQRVCETGIFEPENTKLLQRLCRPGTCLFDVGGNLGLMALPVLRAVSESTVVSFEPSPNALPWLRRTVADSGAGARWRIVESAIGRSAGTASFSVSALADGLYDGLTHTGRTGEARKVEVPVTTLDLEWKRLSQPQVSVVKIDVEGGELDVLRGGQELLARLRPFVLTEWCRLNYRAYGIRCDALLSFAHEHGYLLYAAPEMIPLTNARDMDVQAMRTDSYLMAPRELSE